MKPLFSILILCAVLAQTFSKCILFLNYEMNKEYISKVMCENRHKPRLHCNGKCYLKKQWDKEEKREQSPFNPIKEKTMLQFFSDPAPLLFSFRTSTEVTWKSFSTSLHMETCPVSVFRPPQV